MTHTIKEAQALWCPMVRATNGTDSPANCGNSEPYRKAEFARCIADQCAMWRPGKSKYQRKEITVRSTDVKHPPMSTGLHGRIYDGLHWNIAGYTDHGASIILWRDDDELPPVKTGYCGLAGRPEVGA